MGLNVLNQNKVPREGEALIFTPIAIGYEWQLQKLREHIYQI